MLQDDPEALRKKPPSWEKDQMHQKNVHQFWRDNINLGQYMFTSCSSMTTTWIVSSSTCVPHAFSPHPIHQHSSGATDTMSNPKLATGICSIYCTNSAFFCLFLSSSSTLIPVLIYHERPFCLLLYTCISRFRTMSLKTLTSYNIVVTSTYIVWLAWFDTDI